MTSFQQQQLVEDNIGLAFAVANQYVARFPRLRDMRKDLEQEAFLGLVQAAKKYDESKGTFGTYAWYWASSRIRDYVHANVNPASGVPNTQRNGQPAVFLGSESFDLKHVDTVGAENLDEETLDKDEVTARFKDELVGLMRTKTESRNPERDVDVFLSPITGEISEEQAKMSKQRVLQVRKRVRPLFEALAADYRGEAA